MIEITVIGEPAPQGSKRHVGKGIMVESSKKVRPWRIAVTQAAREALDAGTACKFLGPVSLEVVFTVKQPKSAKKFDQPSKKPDLSKLLRSTEDAITDAGIWEDDSRVVSVKAVKTYPKGHPRANQSALDVPGAVIRIFRC